jgi:hypothetical protein
MSRTAPLAQRRCVFPKASTIMQRCAARACVLGLVSLLACACAGKSGTTGSEPGAAGSSGAGLGGGSACAGGSDAAGGDASAFPGDGAVGDPLVPPSQRCDGPCPHEGERPVPTARPKCPAMEPTSGESCADLNLQCSYGDSAGAPCRRLYQCQAGDGGQYWFLDPARQQSYPCQPLPDGYCPGSPPAKGGACVAASYNTPCVYGTLVCYCEGLGDAYNVPGTMGAWGCLGPPADLNCPASLPNIGEGCSTSGTECDYAEGCLDPTSGNVFCFEGAWEQGTPYTCSGK